MSRSTYQTDPQTTISRLSALLWIMEGIATYGFNTGARGPSRSQPASKPPQGDLVVARWLTNLTGRINSMVDRYHTRLDDRQPRNYEPAGQLSPIAREELRLIQQDRKNRCPNCGTRQDARGTL